MDPDSTRRMVDRGRRVLRAHGDLSRLDEPDLAPQSPLPRVEGSAPARIGWPARVGVTLAVVLLATVGGAWWRVSATLGPHDVSAAHLVSIASPTAWQAPVATLEPTGTSPAGLVPTTEPTATATALPPAAMPTAAEASLPVVDRRQIPPVSVPIMMYHYIRYNPDPNDAIGVGLSVAPDVFDAQMAYLSNHDYHTITMDDLDRYFQTGGKLPSKPIILTFDDGYADAYEQAFPVLKKHGFKATVYVITGRVGAPGYATWEQLKEMSQEVFTVGAHTVDHPDLTKISLEDAAKEISGSKATIEQVLGIKVTSFNYPSGRFDDDVVQLVQEAGFHTAVTTQPGTRHDPMGSLRLLRVRVNGGQPVGNFIASFEGE